MHKSVICQAIYWFFACNFLTCASQAQYRPGATDVPPVDARPTPRPDRILLTWEDTPTTSQTVTWRTDSTVQQPKAEIAESDASPIFTYYAKTINATTTPLATGNGKAHYHTTAFTNLKPNTLYAYRVGDGTYWSEWFQFRTANDKPEPFSFIYFGDAQNELFSLWSRAIRAAYADAPKAKFMVHAGDLINHSNNDTEWHEWFAAGSFIHATIPSIPTPGNHEYSDRKISRLWQPQFNMPKNGLPGMEDMVYYVDYQNVRVISLNSNENAKEQVSWLEDKLKNNPQRWTFVTFHHPIFSSAKGRNNEELQQHWKPLFDKYKVDVVLQGHDHTYARGTNLPTGVSKQEENVGTVYVVSVSGPKMYNLTNSRWMERAAENTQLYQVIRIDGDKLTYTSVTVTGELYDAFELTKRTNQPNLLTERKPDRKEERRFDNTIRVPKDNVQSEN